MNQKNAMLGTAVAVAILGAGCVNDDYDLSDIDTTTQVKVEDLVIPVNISDVTLGDIITFDEDSKIKPVTIDGKTFYALWESGEFSSDEIEVASVYAEAPALSSTERWLDPVTPPASVQLPAGTSAVYNITSMGNDINYTAGSVDEAIVSIKSVGTDMTFTVTMNMPDNAAGKMKVLLENVRIQMPVGLDATADYGAYDPATGIWTIDRYDAGTSTSAKAELKVRGIDFEQAGAAIDGHRRLSYDGEFRLIDGTVTMTLTEAGTMPAQLHFRADYGLTDLVAKTFTGVINYKLAGIDIEPVSLNDIPDFLACEGTNIELASPQIYLQVNNPVAASKLDCATGLTLTALRDNAPALDFSLDGANEFIIGHDLGEAGPYNFVLTPPAVKELNVPDGYSAGLKRVDYTSLSDLLATPEGSAVTGIPSQIDIRLDNPQIPTSPVTDFVLDTKLPGVDGSYTLVAPLALTSKSQIIYTEREDGWNDDTVDALTISALSLTATVSNGTPLGVDLYAWPLDVDGKRIAGVEVRSTHLAAGSADTPVTIEMTGTVTHLDGIEFEARVNGSDDTSALTPSQRIILKNIRARVSGYYEKEL